MRKNTRTVAEAFDSQDRARPCPAIWTDGDAVYSYGTCIATRIQNGVPGYEAIVINRTSYSMTTACHQNGLAVWFAMESPSTETIEVDDMPYEASAADLEKASAVSILGFAEAAYR